MSTRALLVTGLGVSLLLAGVVSAVASAHPDGLEYVAERLGFAGTAGEHGASRSPLADYETTGVGGALGGGIAGVVGVLLVALVMWGLLRLLTRRRGDDRAGPRPPRARR